MHSAVMQNKKYIAFAADNTVEVLVMSSLDRAIQQNDPKAATYKKKGDDAEYMVQWPSLTAEQINSFRQTKAGTYNNTGGIPYTCIVDPHTLERMTVVRARSAKAIIELVKDARRTLMKEHGKGMSRAVIRKLNSSLTKAREQAADGEWSKAMQTLTKGSKGSQDWPESLQERLAGGREAIVGSARAALEKIRELGESDPKKARRELLKLRRKVKGTGIENDVTELMESLATG